MDENMLTAVETLSMALRELNIAGGDLAIDNTYGVKNNGEEMLPYTAVQSAFKYALVLLVGASLAPRVFELWHDCENVKDSYEQAVKDDRSAPDSALRPF